MISIFNEEWRGVLALIWLACGCVIFLLLDRFLDPLFREYFSTMWMVGGWLLPTLWLAISGIRNGNVVSKICGVLTLLALATPVVCIIYVGHGLTGH